MPFNKPSSSTPDSIGRIKIGIEDYGDNIKAEARVQILDQDGEVMKELKGDGNDFPDDAIKNADTWLEAVNNTRQIVADITGLDA